jgi:uncharacterized membrane protein YccF (DUF307 family)
MFAKRPEDIPHPPLPFRPSSSSAFIVMYNLLINHVRLTQYWPFGPLALWPFGRHKAHEGYQHTQTNDATNAIEGIRNLLRPLLSPLPLLVTD